ncbi:MAG: thioredoxin domain-containing protein [Planctomycetes bacterium]|nr:thioredoxin domain-containing protein [Planctomycetota bacterium]
MPEHTIQWLEWSDEAFRRAQKEDKPILLSLGAFWDPWSRLMERDTYADTDVAILINRDYVPVRVDVDRRPDIHDRYQTGGLPGTVFLTPQGDLLWGTGFMDASQMKQILARLREGFASQRSRLSEAIRERDAKIARVLAGRPADRAALGEEVLRRTVSGIMRTVDASNGGFGSAPKLPMIPSLRLLLRMGDEASRRILQKTLDAMMERGLHDAGEGGFHRACATEMWGASCTEKLAIDNAGHIRLYLEAGRALRDPRYLECARATATWAMKVLYDPARAAFGNSQAANVDRTLIAEANAEMAGALIATGDETFATAGRRAIETVLAECRDPERGLARYIDGEPRGFGILRDHAAVARTLIDTYEFFADRRYLVEAERLLEFIWNRFWDEAEQGLLDRRPGFEELGELRLKRRNIDDNAIACQATLRWAAHSGDHRWHTKVERALASLPATGAEYGHPTAELAVAVEWLVRPIIEITIVAPFTSGGLDAMRAVAFQTYLPRRIIRWVDSETESGATVVCEGRRLPIAHTPDELADRLATVIRSS